MDDAREGNLNPAVQAVQKRWHIVVIVVIVAVAASIAFSLTRDETYASSAKVLVEPVVTTGSGPVVIDSDEIATQGEIVISLPISTAVVQNLGLSESPEDLLNDVTVTTDNTRVITITAIRADAEDAAGIANAFADAYSSFRKNEASVQAAARRDSLTQQLTNLEKRIARVGHEMSLATGSQLKTLAAERRSAQVQMGQVLSELSQLNSTDNSAETATVLFRASSSPQPTGRDPVTTAILVAILALVAGVGLAMLRERWAETPHHDYAGDHPQASTLPIQR